MKDVLDMLTRPNSTCTDCWEVGSPPDTILTIPPPPMPSFLMLAFNDVISSNHSNSPCPLLCDWTTGQGVELNELTRKDNIEEHSMFLLSSVFFMGTILLAVLAGIFIFKYRQTERLKLSVRTKTYNHRTYESILYPPPADNQDLWATMTNRGTPRHIVAPPPLPPRINQVKSFENSAFSVDDFPIKYGRPRVSFPMRIENPNIPPLNCYPSLRKNYPSLL